MACPLLSQEVIACHPIPHRPVVAEALPGVKPVRNLLEAESAGEADVLVEKRILIADGEHVALAANAIEIPRIFELRQIIERRIEIRVLIVEAVEKFPGDVECAGHT